MQSEEASGLLLSLPVTCLLAAKGVPVNHMLVHVSEPCRCLSLKSQPTMHACICVSIYSNTYLPIDSSHSFPLMLVVRFEIINTSAHTKRIDILLNLITLVRGVI